MKIAVATDDGTRLSAHAGRCDGFVIFEVVGHESVRLEERRNAFTAHAQGACALHSAGRSDSTHHSHASLLDALGDCRVLVTRGLGPRLVADLATRGIEAFVCAAERVDDAAQQYAGGQLPRASGTGCCDRH